MRGRAGCYLLLDGEACFPKDMSRKDRYHLDSDRAKSLDPYLDFTQDNGRYEITANIPESDIHNPDFRKAFIEINLELNVCDSPNDVRFFDNEVVVTKLKSKSKNFLENKRNLKKRL